MSSQYLVARTLLGAPGIATRNKKLLGAPGLITRNKKLLGAPGLITRSKDATRNKKLLGFAQTRSTPKEHERAHFDTVLATGHAGLKEALSVTSYRPIDLRTSLSFKQRPVW